MTVIKSPAQVAMDNQASPEHEEAIRKSAERAELREALLRKLAKPTKISKAADKKSTEEQILEELRKISAKLGSPAEDNARYLTARAMGVDPGRGRVPPAPHEDHVNAGHCPPPMLAEWLRGKII